ncbi:HypC/HybG/HupF family hydrogenase formation chaperone [Actinomadura craniellae]|uniref:HypC/HybG/HupF family hydrogenase formation chaperone n=1 Tax=Actinomadura craniellae TaxID=2231787 RepID=A0A365H994_9ACTN|nr:HypC/HybG/HupF family hydrogenase formation chaperone [Actinomadura craniellae]
MCLGIPGELIAFHDDPPDLATVDVSGVRRKINIALLAEEELRPGDWVLVHVGFAMSRISESEARAVLDFLEEMGPAYDDELAALRDSARDSARDEGELLALRDSMRAGLNPDDLRALRD